MKRPSEQRRKLPPELEAFARSDDEKLRIRRPRTDQGRVRDPREGYTVAGVSNRDARAVYDVRTEAMRALWAEGQANAEALAALGELFHDALRLSLWHARRLTSFAALAEEVVGVPAEQAEALAEAFAERSGEPLTPLTERAIALWLRTEAGLYEGDEQARARIRSQDGTLVLELSVALVHVSTALAGAGARHLPLARSPREYEEGMRHALGERPARLSPEPEPLHELETLQDTESPALAVQTESEVPTEGDTAPDFASSETHPQFDVEDAGTLDQLEAALPTESASPAGARLLTRKTKPRADSDAELRAASEFGLRAPRPSAQGSGAGSFADARAPRENERPRFGGDRGPGAGREEHSRFGNDRAAHGRDVAGGRGDERPRFGEERGRGAGGRDERPRFAGRAGAASRDDRPRFGGDRAADAGREQSRAGGRGGFAAGRDERPRFGGGDRGSAGARDERPRFGGGERGFAGGRDDRPRFGGGRGAPAARSDERPRFGAGRDDRPRFGGGRGAPAARSDERPRFGAGRDDRPRFGGDRSRAGSGRDDRPRFGGDRGFAGGGARDERPGFAGGRGRAGARDDRPRFGGERGGRDEPPRFEGARPRQGGFVDRAGAGPVSRFGDKGKPTKSNKGFGARELLPRSQRTQEPGPGEGATRADAPRGRDDDDSFE